MPIARDTRRMPTVPILSIAALACLSLAATGCAQLRAARSQSVDVDFPEFAELVRGDERLSELRVTVHCASVRGLSHMPDGWSTKIEPLGDHYVVTVRPRQSLARYDGRMPELRISMRGTGSDCYGVKLVATVIDKEDGLESRSFRTWTRPGRLIH